MGQKVRLKYMSSEPDETLPDRKTLMQGWYYTGDDPLLDGPVSRRLAVIDLDPETGAVVPGARFIPPKNGRPGRYDLKSEVDTELPAFKQVSVFSAVMRMMELFESPDVLGRPLRWAFDGEQLLIVPRAGRMANAFYHRDSRGLQFFFVDDPEKEGQLVYTCLSPDIVAHETTHAILDGIAPDLYDSTSPQSLALHEAIADLGAVMLAIRTAHLREAVLVQSEGDLSRPGAFNEVALQFGRAVHGDDRPLRDLYNDVSFLTPEGARLRKPHDLSTILTGALYALLVAEYDEMWSRYSAQAGTSETDDAGDAEAPDEDDAAEDDAGEASEEGTTGRRLSESGRALAAAGDIFKRVVFRALDYLPPGEISFADYGRAIIAADVYSNPEHPRPRDFLKAEFVKRGIVDAPEALDPVEPGFDLPPDLDLDQLVRSDWAAYRFAETFRARLMIPEGVPFQARPRLDVTRTTWRGAAGKAMNRALLFKVSWQETQGFGTDELVREVAVTRGTTLAIDWASRKVCTLLTTNPAHASQRGGLRARDEEMRVAFLASALASGRIELGGPDAQLQEGVLSVRSLGRMLHVERDND